MSSKFREALERSTTRLEGVADCYPEIRHLMLEQVEENKSALAEPVRNCEVGTAEEQYYRFCCDCAKHKMPCRRSYTFGCAECYAKWSQMKYIVRRLSPIECERLTGLPDGWTIPKNLEVTDALVEEFRIIHDNFKRIMAEYENEPPPKPASAARVRKWLEKIVNPDTCPDAPRYKSCGNGWATNQPRWILTRLLTTEGAEW